LPDDYGDAAGAADGCDNRLSERQSSRLPDTRSVAVENYPVNVLFGIQLVAVAANEVTVIEVSFLRAQRIVKLPHIDVARKSTGIALNKNVKLGPAQPTVRGLCLSTTPQR
jgi:hypothetical protein